MYKKMMETGHYLTEREPEGVIYCMRCGLHNPSEEDSCTPMRAVEMPDLQQKAA